MHKRHDKKFVIVNVFNDKNIEMAIAFKIGDTGNNPKIE